MLLRLTGANACKVNLSCYFSQIDHGRSVRYVRGENVYAGRGNDQSRPSYEDIELNMEKNWWEIPRNSIKIGDELGSGAFGVVKKGFLIVGDKTEECAVKMLKSKCCIGHSGIKQGTWASFKF